MLSDRFEFYGYSSPTDGTWIHDGTVYSYGEDFRTVARYKEYLNAGFNVVLLQHENEYNGEKWETSNTKLCMDNAYKAGADKIIVSDGRIKELCKENDDIVGDGRLFATESDLDARMAEYVAPYASHPAFYGMQLKDEPRFYQFKAYGRVYRSLKRVVPNVFLQCNLFPMSVAVERFSADKTDPYEAYSEYLESYLDATDGDSICFDEYPFRRDGITHDFCLRSLQLAARICKRRDKELRIVIQSFGMLNPSGRITFRNCTENDIYWQLNLMVGLGVKNIGYFTYCVKQQNVSENEKFLDGASLINRDGTRTRLYYKVKKIHSEFRSFEKILSGYEYNGMRLFTANETEPVPDYLDKVDADVLSAVKHVEIKHGNVLITELAGADGYVYAVQNITDPFYNDEASLCIEFRNGFKTEKYRKGKEIEYDGNLKLGAGQAAFFKLTAL